jgi:hypothetical protein
MQQRQLVWLIGVFAILLVIAFVSGTFSNEISTVNVPNFSIPLDQIEEVELTMTDGSTTRIERQNGGWLMVEPLAAPADSQVIARFAESLQGLELESVVSTNPDRYANYGVEDNAKKVKVTWGGDSEAFYVGNAGPDFQSLYLRLEDDPRVFLSRGRLTLPDHSDPWRDRTLIDVAVPDIDRIVVTSPNFDYEVVRSDEGWEIMEDGDRTDADSALVAQWLNRFAPLTGLGFLDEPALANLKAEASHQIHFNTPQGSPRTIWFMDMDPNTAATASGSSFVFRLATSTLTNLIPDPESLEDDS